MASVPFVERTRMKALRVRGDVGGLDASEYGGVNDDFRLSPFVEGPFPHTARFQKNVPAADFSIGRGHTPIFRSRRTNQRAVTTSSTDALGRSGRHSSERRAASPPVPPTGCHVSRSFAAPHNASYSAVDGHVKGSVCMRPASAQSSLCRRAGGHASRGLRPGGPPCRATMLNSRDLHPLAASWTCPRPAMSAGHTVPLVEPQTFTQTSLLLQRHVPEAAIDRVVSRAARARLGGRGSPGTLEAPGDFPRSELHVKYGYLAGRGVTPDALHQPVSFSSASRPALPSREICDSLLGAEELVASYDATRRPLARATCHIGGFAPRNAEDWLCGPKRTPFVPMRLRPASAGPTSRRQPGRVA